MNTLAPIVLFTYNRPKHTLETLKCLSKNKLANKSELFIFCDGPKLNSTSENLDKIQEVRRIVKSEKWCKEVVIFESDKNIGLANSIISGVSKIINQFKKVIVLEDDLQTSESFLLYMNKSLDYYESFDSVFSISAYNYPPTKMIIPNDYEYDVFVSLRNGSWGWGTWENRWGKIDWDVKNYNTILKDKYIQKAFNRGGDDVFPMLMDQQSGKLNIWSIQFTFAHFTNHSISITPVKSFVNNIGMDGTGENCKKNDGLINVELNTKESFNFLPIIYQDDRIINLFHNISSLNKRPVWKKIINRISRIFIGKNVYVLKSKVYI